MKSERRMKNFSQSITVQGARKIRERENDRGEAGWRRAEYDNLFAFKIN